MTRIFIAALVAIAMVIAVPAAATVTEQNAHTGSGDVYMELTIGCYTNVWWNNVDVDHTIIFNDNTGATGDWYNATTLIDQYTGTSTKAATDPYAEGYYESLDDAFFWIQANCDVGMTITTGGKMHTTAGDSLDSWFTMALTNQTNCTPAVGADDCGFIDAGIRASKDGDPPTGGVGDGSYADGSGGDPMTLFGGSFWPNQWPFPMGASAATYTANFQAYSEGTLTFHARVLRNGISDPAGVYSSTLDFSFSETTP